MSLVPCSRCGQPIGEDEQACASRGQPFDYIDCAAVPRGELGTTHRFTLGARL